MYDMDMRDYDPAIARWVVQDPVVHYDYSPYNAFDNNPVIFADPSGADAYEDKDGYHFTGAEAQSFFSQLQSQLGSSDNENGDTEPVFEMTGPEVVVTGQALYSNNDYAFRNWARDNSPSIFAIIRENEANGHYNKLTSVLKDYWGNFGNNFNDGYRSWNPNGAGADMMDIASTLIGNTLLGPAADGIIGAYAFEAVVASKATSTGLTESQLVQKAASLAERAIGGSGPVAGTNKHTYAINLLRRYQSMYGGNLSLGSNYFNNGIGNRGFLDVVNHTTKTIYDFKFGNAVMSNAQFLKYSRNFEGYGIHVIRP